jgi:adenosine deaminase
VQLSFFIIWKLTSEDQRFIGALQNNHRELLQTVPKSDLHSHAGLAFRLEILQKFTGEPISPPHFPMYSIFDLNQWIHQELEVHYLKKSVAEFALKAALVEAWNDGITLLEMSLDISFIHHFKNNPATFADFITEAHRQVAPEINFRPELGIARDADPEVYLPLALECLETGIFRSIDLYGTEDAREAEVYRELYLKARTLGLKCKVHSGEFGNSEDMAHAIRVLHPHAIQHGFAAAGSAEVMRMLREENITLNICPTSNLMLSRVPGYSQHPVRTLFDHGIGVTINSDDIMVFGSLVTDEYLHLYQNNLFSAEELNLIRLYGLNQ